MKAKQMNVVEKILSAHLVEGDPAKDPELGIRIDQTLTQDATGTMAYLQFESMGVPRVKTDLSVSYVDHNTVQIGFENADDHDFLQSVAKKYGIVYSKCGNGICHQLHLERFGKPGTTLLGSDSHTPTGGGVGQIAIGAGGIDIAVAMAGGAFHIPTPKVRAIVLKGKLRKGVSAKDVILKVLEKFGTKGNVGWIFEYTGPGVATLDVPSRATIANMGAELGVTTSVFPSDAVTKQFLAAQGRAKDFVKIVADKGAKYDDTFTVDLSKVEPMMAAPHSPGNVVTVKSKKGLKVNQIMIGSCTNSSYRDIRTVALYLKGKHVADDVEVGIACGSRQVINMLAKDGSLAILHAAGCRMLENACGFCIGAHMSPRTGAVSLRTNNRNFEGRSGTKSAQVYLVSPETAAASALTGKVELPTKNPVAAVPSPKKFPIDDAMFLYRATAGKGVKGAEIEGRAPRQGPQGRLRHQGRRQDHDGPHHAGGRAAQVPLEHPAVREVRLRAVRSEVPRQLHGEQGEGPCERDRRGRELRTGLLARARCPLPDVPRREGRDREVDRAHPQGEPRQLRHRAVLLRESEGLRQDSCRRQAGTQGDTRSRCRRRRTRGEGSEGDFPREGGAFRP